jgi:hypothetical protein
MESFRASVQYDDWTGTAAADDADQVSLSAFLRKRGAMADGDFLAAVHVWIGENHGGHAERPTIEALLLDGAPSVQDVTHLLEEDPVRVRRVPVEISLEEFVGLFKRLAVNFYRGQGDLSARRFEVVNP